MLKVTRRKKRFHQAGHLQVLDDFSGTDFEIVSSRKTLTQMSYRGEGL